MFEQARDELAGWARGRAWLPRAVVTAALAWLALRLLLDPEHPTLFGAIDLGIHEAGHLVFRFGGARLCAFGGTLLQCLAPIGAAVALARRPDWFGVGFCGCWLAINLYEVARYVADARAQRLPLVTVGGGDAQHDWAFLLGELGWLRADTLLATLLRAAAFLVYWSALAGCAGLCIAMFRSRREAR